MRPDISLPGCRHTRLRIHPQASRRGSVALEAALTVPLFLLVLLFLVSAIQTSRAEIRLRTAADRTAAEIALLPPVVFSLIDEDSLRIPVTSLLDGLQTPDTDSGANTAFKASDALSWFIEPDELESVINDAALDLASSIAFGRLVSNRIRFWLARQGSLGVITAPSVFLDWNLADDQLFLNVYYQVRTLNGQRPRQLTAFVPIWRAADPKSEPDHGSTVWDMDNFARGRALRKKHGGNLPDNYPVIARFESGEALAIKSVDLNKPTYDDPNELFRKVSPQIEALAGFVGTATPFGKAQVMIRASDIRSKRLLLVIPADSDLGRFRAVMNDLNHLADQHGVTFEMVTYQKSRRD